MINCIKKIALIMILFISSIANVNAQGDRTCVAEVLKLEQNTRNNVKDENVVYMNYTIRTTDWEGQVINSEVKVYKGKDNTHFFSDQANIFQDQKDVYMVLPVQKLIMINSTKKELYDQRLSDDFYDMKKELLDSCEIIKCDSSKQFPGGKTLELKAKGNMRADIKVNRMIYEYNVAENKIERATLFFKDDYKIKQIIVTYKEINMNSDYKFGNARKQILDNDNKLAAKYKDYQLIDNRKN